MSQSSFIECHMCGNDISDSWQDENRAIGCYRPTWYCEECKQTIEDDQNEDEAFASDAG